MGRPLHNLLLLTVDAWRADFVDLFGGIPLMPTLHSLLPGAVRFTNAYATGPWTSPALVSIFSGENPALHGIHHEWSVPRPGGPALAARLQAAGYTTPNVCYLNRVGNYQNLGYEAASAPDYPKGPDDDLLVRTLRELRSGDGQPWFVWYHYKYVHLPYWPVPAYRRLFSVVDDELPQRLRESVASRFVVPRGEFTLLPEDREPVRRLYAGGVRQMDDFLGRVVEELRAGDQLERTTLILTADHGDELLERGHVGHASTAHHATLYEEVLRVPLMIIDPRVQTGRVVAERVQGLDLFPTILSLAGAPAGDAGEAVDLAPLVLDDQLPSELRTPRTFFAQSARMGYLTPRSHQEQEICSLSDGRHKFIWERYDEPRRLLFNLEQDPHELEPITAGPAVESAHQALLDFLALPEKPAAQPLVAPAAGEPRR